MINIRSSNIIKKCALVTILAFSIFSSNLSAKTVEKTISLIDKEGNQHKVAKITFKSEADNKKSFAIDWDDSKFSEHFLSMRPFKCIDGLQTFCRLEYPYKTRNRITDSDLQDLEYALLFLHKNQQEYGINFWNGVYYRLKKDANGVITGSVWETDMNELASPPAKEYGRPIGGADLVEGVEGKHRFPKIIIQ